MDAKLLRFVQRPEQGGSVIASDGRRLLVLRQGDEFWGADDEEAEADPVLLSPDDLSRCRLSLEDVAQRLHDANGLQGEPCCLGDRLHYLGFRVHDGLVSAVVLAFLVTEQLAVETALAVPAHVSDAHTHYVLVCPSFSLRGQDGVRRLQDAGVQLCGLAEGDVWRVAWPALPTDAAEALPARVVLVMRDNGALVEFCGERVNLTPTEQRVMLALAQRPKRPIAVGDLGEAGWSSNGPNDLADVRRVIMNLRRKLNEARTGSGEVGLSAPEDVIVTHAGRYSPTLYELALRQFQVSISE